MYLDTEAVVEVLDWLEDEVVGMMRLTRFVGPRFE
jgi:hypothetical protein